MQWKTINQFLVSHESGCLYLYDKTLIEQAPINVDAKEMKNIPFYVIYNKKSNANPVLKVYLSSTLSAFRANNENIKQRQSGSAVIETITSFRFSPVVSSSLLASATTAGKVYLIDSTDYKIKNTFYSYYGAVLSVAWSLDGKYLFFGGEDEIVSIIDIEHQSLCARGINGHKSFISNILCFSSCRIQQELQKPSTKNPSNTRKKDKIIENGYRDSSLLSSVASNSEIPIVSSEDVHNRNVLNFYSVGQDGILSVWEFLPSSLRPPSLSEVNNGFSLEKGHSSKQNIVLVNEQVETKISNQDEISGGKNGVANPSLDLDDVPTFQPVSAMNKIHLQSITDMDVFDGGIVTICSEPIVKIWKYELKDHNQQSTFQKMSLQIGDTICQNKNIEKKDSNQQLDVNDSDINQSLSSLRPVAADIPKVLVDGPSSASLASNSALAFQNGQKDTRK